MKAIKFYLSLLFLSTTFLAQAGINQEVVETFLSQKDLISKAQNQGVSTVNVLKYEDAQGRRRGSVLHLGVTNFSMMSTFEKGFVTQISRDASRTLVDGPVMYEVLEYSNTPYKGFDLSEDLHETRILIEAMFHVNVSANLNQILSSRLGLLNVEGKSVQGVSHYVLTFGHLANLARDKQSVAKLYISADLRGTMADGPAVYTSRIEFLR